MAWACAPSPAVHRPGRDRRYSHRAPAHPIAGPDAGAKGNCRSERDGHRPEFHRTLPRASRHSNHFSLRLTAQREKEIQTVTRHLELSLNELIHRQNLKLAGLVEIAAERAIRSPLAGREYRNRLKIGSTNSTVGLRGASASLKRSATAPSATFSGMGLPGCCHIPSGHARNVRPWCVTMRSSALPSMR